MWGESLGYRYLFAESRNTGAATRSMAGNDMVVELLEVQRARRAINAFCETRNQGQKGSARQWCCRQDGEYLLLIESSGPAASLGGQSVSQLVRFQYQERHWLLFCPDQNGNWRPYPVLPRAENIADVLEELEQAPLHVHW